MKSDPEKDNGEPGSECAVVGEIAGHAEVDVEIDETVVEAVHTVPVEYAALYRVTLGEPARLEVALADADVDGVVFVLLRECTNACKNRISWGEEICSPALAAGEYILAVYSERVRSFSFVADLLSPEESCDGLDFVVDC